MRNKRILMGIAALLILVFHFYIPFTSSKIETFVYRLSYIGVDIFFFLSGYSAGNKETISYKSFITNRLKFVYIPFVILTIINTLYNHWKPERLLKVVTGIELLQRGGGSFLWFFPAITIIYLITPLIIKLKQKFGIKSFIGLLATLLLIVYTLQYIFNYTTIFILLNRIPIFLIGIYFTGLENNISEKYKTIMIFGCLIIGIILAYKYGSFTRLNKPISETYYLVVIPLTLSIIGLVNKIPYKLKPLQFIGNLSLELYGLQMIFGYPIILKLAKIFGTNTLTFIIMSIILIIMAYIFKTIYTGLITKLETRRIKT